MIFKKIKKLTKKAFSSKTYMLMGINRVIPDTLGEMTDIMVDRENKNIFLQLELDGNAADLNILNYGMEYQGNTAYLVFQEVEKSGYLNTMLKDIEKNKKVKVDPKYIKLVERMI